MRLPDFVIVGAMKSATSTLHDQLAANGAFMSTPKEPNFFSDDDIYACGMSWYAGLFAQAPSTAVVGESSTHYTKLPTYPDTIERLTTALPDAKFVYVMRHPIDRLVSHFIHEWTMGVMGGSIDKAVIDHPPLVEYGLYAKQMDPWLSAVGPQRVLPVFFDRLTHHPQQELQRIADFVGLTGAISWVELSPQNVSAERLRRNDMRDTIVDAPVLSQLRRLLPQGVRDWVKSHWQMTERPELSRSTRHRLEEEFDADLAQLGRWLGIELSCATFRQTAELEDPRWRFHP